MVKVGYFLLTILQIFTSQLATTDTLYSGMHNIWSLTLTSWDKKVIIIKP